GIDLAYRAQLVFSLGLEGTFVLELLFGFSLAEKSANHVADAIKPAFTFEARFVLELAFDFLFAFSRILFFEFGLYQFTLGLISHDGSSCNSGQMPPLLNSG